MRQYRQYLHRRDLLLVTAKDFEGLDAKLTYYQTCAIPKPAPRKRSPKVLEQARQRGHCEYCGVRCRPHPHHVTTRGAGGGDEHDNIVSLCAFDHERVHAGHISKKTLLEIVAARRGK